MPTTILSFFAPGLPKAQPRLRACRRGRHAGVYDPGTADSWKASVMLATRQALKGLPQPPPAGQPLLSGPVRADLTYVFPRPKAHFKPGRHAPGRSLFASDATPDEPPDSQATLRPGAPHHHTARPDRDNLDKAVLDTLTLAQVWKDDAQVCAGATLKRYAAPGEPAGCHITLTALPQM